MWIQCQDFEVFGLLLFNMELEKDNERGTWWEKEREEREDKRKKKWDDEIVNDKVNYYYNL